MISLTRLTGSQFVLNSDLIERIDSTPDTVVTLVDGKKYVVVESPDEIVDAIRRHHGSILSLSSRLADQYEQVESTAPPVARRLTAVSTHPGER